MPIPAFPPGPVREVRHGLVVLDQYDRVADRAAFRALGWGPGHPLALTVTAGSVLAVSRLESRAHVGNDGHLRVPVGVRRACRLVTGHRVLLVADPDRAHLLLHPPAVLAGLLEPHHTAIAPGTTP